MKFNILASFILFFWGRGQWPPLPYCRSVPMLRYSNVNFIGVASWSPTIIGQNTANQLDFYSLTQLDSLTMRVNVAEKLYDTDYLTVILSGQSVISYGLVQCTRDIDGGLCVQCLNGLMDLAKNCCQAKIGWRILAPSCNLRYENQRFTDQPPATPLQPPPPPQSVPPAPQPPPGNGKSYRFGIFMEIYCSIFWAY